ncbi:MAG: MCE family protein [Myxococcales bacterium]|nr:MCE family protein [Myxococcales bacterium]
MRTTALGILLLLAATGCEPTHHARVDDGAGLEEGSAVMVSGVRVGDVKSVHVVEGQVDVEFVIGDDHDVTLRTDSCALAVRREGQPPQLVIVPGEAAPLTEEQAIPQCQLPTDSLDGIARQLGGTLGEMLRSFGGGLLGGGGPGGGGSGGGTIPLPLPIPGLRPPPSPSTPSTPDDAPPDHPTDPPPPPDLPPPPPSFDGACDGLSVRVERTEAAGAVPVFMPQGGHKVWLEVRNDSDRTMRVGSIAQATFTDADRRALTPVRLPSDTDLWFMPFDVPAHGTASRAVVFEGPGAPRLDEIEARRSAPAADPLDWCTLHGTRLSR